MEGPVAGTYWFADAIFNKASAQTNFKGSVQIRDNKPATVIDYKGLK